MVLAPLDAPGPGAAARIRGDALARVNAARAAGRRCGGRWFAPAPPLAENARLDLAAAAHAETMARRDALEHDAADGTPASRARRAGYAAAVVGENIAGGVATPAEAVDGWLASPGHCANLMDPRFTDTGLAYASSRSGRLGIYWAEELAAPAH